MDVASKNPEINSLLPPLSPVNGIDKENVGEEVQRLSVIRDLLSLLQADEQGCLQRVIQKIHVALGSATTEFHIETARAFSLILEKKTVPPNVFAQSFLLSAIYHIDNRDQVVSSAWLETLLKATELLPLDIVKNNILSVAVTKGQISQNLWQRITACKLLGKMCSRFDSQTVKKDLLPVVLSLCQDVNESVRACICSQLHLVAKGIPSDMIKPGLIPILVELGRDETVQVRVEATETIVKLIPLLSPDVLKVTIIPLIKKICEQAVLATDETLVVVAKQFGGLCIGLEGVLSLSEKLWMVTYYHNLSHMGIPTQGPKKDAFFTSHNIDRLNARYIECRQFCAYNFPAMAKFCSSSPELLEKLFPSFCDFSTDPYYMVRKTIGAGMHEVARILGSNNRIVKNQVTTLLWDNMEEVLMGIVPHLGRTIDFLIMSGALGHEQDSAALELGRGLLQCDKTIRDKTHNWRLYTDFLTQLESIVKCLPSDYIYSHFVSLMFEKMHRARPLPCRLAAARTLLVFLRYNIRNNQRQEIRSRLQSEFCSSSSCYKRMLYLRLCNSAREIFSRAYFKEHFFYPLLSRSEDKVANNRLILIRQFPSLKAMIVMPSEKKYLQTLETCLRSMAILEKDRDVTAELKATIHRMDKTETLIENPTTQTAEDLEDKRKYEEELKVASSMARQAPGYQYTVNDNRRVPREQSKPVQRSEVQTLTPGLGSGLSVSGTGTSNVSPRIDRVVAAHASTGTAAHSVPSSTHSVTPSTHSLAPSTHSVAPSTHSVAPSTHSVSASTHSVAPSSHSIASSYANPHFSSHQTSYQTYTYTTNRIHPLRSFSAHVTNIDQTCTCYTTTGIRSDTLRSLNLFTIVDTNFCHPKQKFSETFRQKVFSDPRIKLTKSAKRSMEISWLNLETDLEKKCLALSKKHHIHGDRNFKEKSKFLSDFRNYKESTEKLRKFISEDRDTIYNVTGFGRCYKKSHNFFEERINFFEERINFFERKIKLKDRKPSAASDDCSCYELTTNCSKAFDEINKFSYFSKNFEEDFYRDAGVKANEVIRRKFSGIPVQDKVPSQLSTPKLYTPPTNKRRTWFGNENAAQGTVKLETITGYKAKSCERKKSGTLPARESVSLKKLGIGPRSKSFVLPSTLIYSDKQTVGNRQSTKQVFERDKEANGKTRAKTLTEDSSSDSDAKKFGFRGKGTPRPEAKDKVSLKTKIPVGIAGNGSPAGSRSSSPSPGKTETGRSQTNGGKKIPVVVSRKSMVIQSTSAKTEIKNNRRSFDPSKISLENLDKPLGSRRKSEKGGGRNGDKDVEPPCNGNLSKLPVRRPKPDK